MSESVFKLIPTDPFYLPSTGARDNARKRLSSFVPGAEEIEAKTRRQIEFIDQCGNFEKVSCPFCGRDLGMESWAEAMGVASGEGFRDLDIHVPCCQKKSSLNDLRYDWPAGFALFSLEVRNPCVERLKLEQVIALQSDLGCSLPVIWANN